METKQFAEDSLSGAGCKSCRIALIICRTVWPRLKIVWTIQLSYDICTLNIMHGRNICYNRLYFNYLVN